MATIVIPARWDSSRYPGKPLALIRGATGRATTLIERSWRAARKVPGGHRVIVATDDERIFDAVVKFGGEAALTPKRCANGTERVAFLAANGPADEVFINFQGDALLTPPIFVARLAEEMESEPTCDIATVGVRCMRSTYDHLVTDQMHGRVGGTTVVCDATGKALYFSKRVLPHINPRDLPANETVPVLLHLGLYAYRRKALNAYASASPSPLEMLEGLEQLRFLHHGLAVRVIKFDPPGWDAIELNNPTDLPVIEKILKELEID